MIGATGGPQKGPEKRTVPAAPMQAVKVPKRTVEHMARKPTVKKVKITESSDMQLRQSACNWETEGNALHYRTAAIDTKHHTEKTTVSLSQDEVMGEEPAGGQTDAQQSKIKETGSRGKPSSQNISQSCPIGSIQYKQDLTPRDPATLLFVERPDDLTKEERQELKARTTARSYNQSADWANPTSERICRCILCNGIIDSNGVERALCSYFRLSRKNVTNPLIL